MPRRSFRPADFDLLEDRLAMSTGTVPFAIVTTQAANEVNPKDLVVTKHAESQISYAITASFARFSRSFFANESAYEQDFAKPGADPNALLTRFNAGETAAFDRLTSDLHQVAKKLPYGGATLFPILKARIEGPAGVTSTTTGINSPSLQTRLQVQVTRTDRAAQAEAISTAQTLVRADVKNYIYLGVTGGHFKLGKGAILPTFTA